MVALTATGTVRSDGSGQVATPQVSVSMAPGSATAGTGVLLEQDTAIPPLPLEYQPLLTARLTLTAPVGSQAVSPLRTPATATLRLGTDTASALAAGTIQAYLLSAKTGLWVLCPQSLDATAATLTLPLRTPATVVVVSNRALVPQTPLQATVDQAGGTLTWARLTLTIPPGAVNGPTQMSVSRAPAPLAPWRGGLPFLFAVTATSLADGSDVAALAVPATLSVTYGPGDHGFFPPAGLRLRAYRAATQQ